LIADYPLQGILCDLKQMSWWNIQISKSAIPDTDRYEWDWLAGLSCHALMWSIMSCLPLFMIGTTQGVSVCIVINAVIHGIIDHLKANMYVINLWQDQILHFVQVIITVGILTY
jgi:hypothetical protein